MEWTDNNQEEGYVLEGEENLMNAGGGVYVKVMTDEQVEILRKQISVYGTITDQLLQMHKSFSDQHLLSFSGGIGIGSFYCDPSITSATNKFSARQRWNPTQVQREALEQIFDHGNGTPTKQKIKEIADVLSKHGQVTETNVYNWFQNRRARSKRKQPVQAPNEGEAATQVETAEVDSSRENKMIQSFGQLVDTNEDYYFENHPDFGLYPLLN